MIIIINVYRKNLQEFSKFKLKLKTKVTLFICYIYILQYIYDNTYI